MVLKHNIIYSNRLFISIKYQIFPVNLCNFYLGQDYDISVSWLKDQWPKLVQVAQNIKFKPYLINFTKCKFCTKNLASSRNYIYLSRTWCWTGRTGPVLFRWNTTQQCKNMIILHPKSRLVGMQSVALWGNFFPFLTLHWKFSFSYSHQGN